MRDLDETVRMIADRPLAEIIALLDREATAAEYAARRTRRRNGPVGEKRARGCDNATELTEFYSSCDIVRQPLGRQKRMTIFAICLQNDCKREENGDACIASLAEKIITISIYKPLRVKTGQYRKLN
jgi:hypothetical protein